MTQRSAVKNGRQHSEGGKTTSAAFRVRKPYSGVWDNL